MRKSIDEWKKLSSDEIEFQRLLDHEKLLRDEASLATGGYVRGVKEGYLEAMVQSFRNMKSKGFENGQIRDFLGINDSDYKEILELLDN